MQMNLEGNDIQITGALQGLEIVDSEGNDNEGDQHPILLAKKEFLKFHLTQIPPSSARFSGSKPNDKTY